MKNWCSEKKMWDIFIDTVNQNRERIAVKYDNHEYTYGEYYKDVCAIACKLKIEDYINKKDVVIIFAKNSYVYACYIMACIKLGVTVIPLNPKMNLEELKKIVVEANPKCIYSDQRWIIEKNIGKHMKLDETENVYQVNEMKNDNNLEVQFILFSSGSTGEIKGIECTQTGIIAATYAINDIIANTNKDNILCILDFSFDYGLYQLFLAYEVGATVTIYSSDDNILRIPEYIFKNSVTGFPATPFLLEILMKAGRIDVSKFTSLRYISSTGEYLNTDIIDTYRMLMPQVGVFSMYGLTECKRVSILTPEEYLKHKNSVGRPISCCDVKIVDAEGEEVECGSMGELVVSGENVMKGYFMDEKLTCEKFVVNENGVVELHTGDIFFMDKEGFLYFVGRTQNFIKIRGKRVSPLTIEDEIMSNSEGIIECLIVPLREISKVDSVFCFLKLKRGYLIEDVISSIKKKVTYIPDYFCNFDYALFRNLNGKIDRVKMSELAKDLFVAGKYISC